MSEKVITSDAKVFMHYTLHLEDGSVADSSLDHDKPAYFEMGAGYISDEFERQMLGLKVNDKKRISLKAHDAFGDVMEQLIYALPRDKFSQIDDLEVGSIVAFTFPNQEEQAGIVRQLSDGIVVVDFNHPLAGRNIIFDVQIVDIKTN